ncbi:Carboxypeptidase G2 precursor [Aminobacter sp. MSH1]|uniref:M20 family metallopeptidase n=1 Tax=Aminobacter sp. MSH1 TaxID=374606 RepID=UPI000D5047CB|nr:M20 family metallopeptidase [Aminobacter sp. MSH1]AWC24216.1 Carboxypeptidase G2 precursor [Aminobacter sp. MSH1]
MTLEKQIVEWFDTRRLVMVELLRDLVNTDSHTYDKEGVDAVIRRLQEFLDSAGVKTHVVEQETAGNFLHADIRAAGSNIAPILLMGHCDTVFPKGEAAKRPFHISDERAYGPGVADMKGGLVVNSFALAALKAHLPEGLPVCALYTSDEEIASPVSRHEIARMARSASVVFNGEPGRPSGNVTVGRKGGIFMRVDVEGRGAHSGSHFSHGISAVEALARKIIELHAVTNQEIGVTVNVGVIGGGLTLNTVAPRAFAEFELRYVDDQHRNEYMARIEKIIAKEHVPGSSARLTITGEFLPLIQAEASKAVYGIYDSAAATLGLHFGEEFSGGCSDAGIPSSLGIPTLCGTGPVGGGSHTIDEYIELDTLVTRAQTLALALLRISEMLERGESLGAVG